MLRRALRILMIVSFAALLATAVVSQFWFVEFERPHWCVVARRGGIDAEVCAVPESDAYDLNALERNSEKWYAAELFPRPALRMPNQMIPGTAGPDASELFVPWWTILPVWGLLVAVVRRLTRRKVGKAFPVEPESAVK